MSIQTSKVITALDANLELEPQGTGKVQLNGLQGASTGDSQVSVDNLGQVKKLDANALPSIQSLSGDKIIIQAGSNRADQGVEVGEIYSLDISGFSGGGAIDPLPADVSANPAFVGGSGTEQDPYVCSPVVVSQAGGTAETVEEITVNGVDGGIVNFTDISAGDSSGRFYQQSGTVSNGSYTFRLKYTDVPATAVGDGREYTGDIKLGSTSVYFRWEVTQVSNASSFGPTSAPTASPPSVNYSIDGKYGAVTTTWADGTRDLSVTNGLVKVNSGSFSNSPQRVNNGDLVSVAFDEIVVANAAEGETITATLESYDGAYYTTFSFVKDTVPATFTIPPLTQQGTSTTVESPGITLRGINAPVDISIVADGTNPLTNPKIVVGGGSEETSTTYNPGDLLKVRAQTGSSGDTAYTATVTVNGVSSLVSFSTGSSGQIVQPSITSPPNLNGEKQATDVSISSTSAAYVQGGSITHTASDWEAYSALPAANAPYVASDTILNSLGYTGNLTDSLILSGDEALDIFVKDNFVQQDRDGLIETSQISNVSVVPSAIDPDRWGGDDGGKLKLNGVVDTEGAIRYMFSGQTLTNTISVQTSYSTGNGGYNGGFTYNFPPGITYENTIQIGYILNNSDPGYASDNMRLSVNGVQLNTAKAPGAAHSSIIWTDITQYVAQTGRELRQFSETIHSGRGWNVQGFKLDGQQLVLDVDSIKVDLTFPDAQDLKYFEPGDIVQNAPADLDSAAAVIRWPAEPTFIGGHALASGLNSTATDYFQSTSSQFTVVYKENINSIKIRLVADQAPRQLQISLPDGTNQRFTANTTNNSWNEFTWNGTGSSKEFTVSGAQKLGFATLEVNGNPITKSTTSSNVQILDIKPPGQGAPYTMSLSGGVWNAPNDAWNQTQIWSTFGNGSQVLHPWTGAFDGQTSDAQNRNQVVSKTDGTIALWDYTNSSVPLYLNGGLIIYGRRDVDASGNSASIFVNGKDVSSLFTENTYGWVDINLTGAAVSDRLEQISIRGFSTGSTSGSMRIGGIEINGDLLVDIGAGGESTVSMLKRGGGYVESINEQTNQLTLYGISPVFIGPDNSQGETFQVIDENIPGKPVPPVDGAANPGVNYQLHEADLNSTSSLTSWKPSTPFEKDSTVFVRVKHKAGGSESEWSNWSGFEVQGAPEAGQELGGGFFVGQILDDGIVYDLIVAPVTGNGKEGTPGGGVPTGIQYKSADTTDIGTFTGVQTEIYGGAISDALRTTGEHPLFEWLDSTAGPNGGTLDLIGGGAGGGDGIGGYEDWYIPSSAELEMCYRFYKPSTTPNATGGGAGSSTNPYSVPPTSSSYTAENPPQTVVDSFKDGGSEAYLSSQSGTYTAYYWTANESSEGTSFYRRFSEGTSQNAQKTLELKARAVRRQPS